MGRWPSDSESYIDEDDCETALRDQQLRGYGIGGAGNIRKLQLAGSARSRLEILTGSGARAAYRGRQLPIETAEFNDVFL